MITILLSKIVELLKELKTNIENLPTGGTDISYSTDENKIGTWIDGSDMYQRSFLLENTGWGEGTWINNILETEGSGINIVNWFGWVRCSGALNQYPLDYYRSSNEFMTVITSNNCDDIILRSNMGLTIHLSDVFITIQYIKPEPEPENNEEV